jgi:hypothetical protein
MNREREMREMHEREQRQDALIARLRLQAGVREDDLGELRERLGAAEHELEDLRAIRDALTPPELPERPGVDVAAAFLPAAERVSGDVYLVAEGPQGATEGSYLGLIHGLRRVSVQADPLVVKRQIAVKVARIPPLVRGG